MRAWSSWKFALPALIIFVGPLVLEAAYGVAPLDALRYAAYEVCFVAAPGWLGYRALSSHPGGALRQLALGWALGYVLEILAFMLTAATGTRALFVAYPLVVGALALAIILRRRRILGQAETSPRMPERFWWFLAAVCLMMSAYIALAYFPTAPLPGVGTADYVQDLPWGLSLAGDAKHHWPIEDPNVSGEAMPYHYFVHVHLAAASQVTGLNLPLVFFRLFILPQVVLIVLLLVVAGQSLVRSAYSGLIAACLAFLVGQVNLAHGVLASQVPFLGVSFAFMIESPSYLLGMVMFVPLVTLIGERITSRESAVQPGAWLVVAFFMVGASDAKVAILPLVLGALMLSAVWAWLSERRIPPAVWVSGALALLVAGTVYALQYRGHSSGLVVDLSAGVDYFNQMPVVALIKSQLTDALPGFPGQAFILSAGGMLLGAFGLFAAQLAGLVWVFRRQGYHLDGRQAWLLSLFGAGLLAVVILRSPGSGNQLYFLFYGLVAGCVLSAQGIRMAWLSRPALSGEARRPLGLAVVGLLVLVGLMAGPEILGPFPGSNSDAHTYLFSYGGFLLLLILLFTAAWKWLGPSKWAALALVSSALLIVGALDTPIEYLEPLLRPQPPPESGRRLTPELYGALSWIRDSTPSTAVIAVNNGEALSFEHSAFAERRVFFGGWGYSLRSRETGYAAVAGGLFASEAGSAGADLFPTRLELNDAAFKRGSHHALEQMAKQYGVRYLVVDRVNGYAVDDRALRRLTRTVYRAPGVLVLELPRQLRMPRQHRAV